MICERCEKELEESMAFCPCCGYDIDVKEPVEMKTETEIETNIDKAASEIPKKNNRCRIKIVVLAVLILLVVGGVVVGLAITPILRTQSFVDKLTGKVFQGIEVAGEENIMILRATFFEDKQVHMEAYFEFAGATGRVNEYNYITDYSIEFQPDDNTDVLIKMSEGDIAFVPKLNNDGAVTSLYIYETTNLVCREIDSKSIVPMDDLIAQYSIKKY